MILSLITYGHILAGERLKVLDTKIATPVYQLILNSTGDFSGEQSFTMTALPTLADYRCSFGGIATGTMHFTVTDLSPYPWIVPKDDDGDLSCYATLEDAQKALLRPTAESRKSEARHRKDGFLGAMTKGDSAIILTIVNDEKGREILQLAVPIKADSSTKVWSDLYKSTFMYRDIISQELSYGNKFVICFAIPQDVDSGKRKSAKGNLFKKGVYIKAKDFGQAVDSAFDETPKDTILKVFDTVSYSIKSVAISQFPDTTRPIITVSGGNITIDSLLSILEPAVGTVSKDSVVDLMFIGEFEHSEYGDTVASCRVVFPLGKYLSGIRANSLDLDFVHIPPSEFECDPYYDLSPELRNWIGWITSWESFAKKYCEHLSTQENVTFQFFSAESGPIRLEGTALFNKGQIKIQEMNATLPRLSISVTGSGVWLGFDGDYYICQTEVSKSEYALIMQGNRLNDEDGSKPISSITDGEIDEFCARLSRREGVSYRIPYEIEWVLSSLYACSKHSGCKFDNAMIVTCDSWNSSNSSDSLRNVRSNKTDDVLLHNLFGNVAERCSSSWLESGIVNLTIRINKGGHYQSDPDKCGLHSGTSVKERDQTVGFRLVATLN